MKSNVNIREYISEFNKFRPKELMVHNDTDGQILGPKSLLDSVDFVEFILGLEEAIAKASGSKIAIFEEEWFSSDEITITIGDLEAIVSDRLSTQQ